MLAGLESPVHLLLLLLIILLLFGAKRLPEMGRSLERGIREFKEELNTKEEPKNAEGERSTAVPLNTCTENGPFRKLASRIRVL